MLSLKTTIGLIAALAVVATTSVASALVPQAFAQNNTVTAFQSNNLKADVDQDIDQYAGSSSDDGTGSTTQTAVQSSCINSNQQNAAGGNTAANFAANSQSASGAFSDVC